MMKRVLSQPLAMVAFLVLVVVASAAETELSGRQVSLSQALPTGDPTTSEILLESLTPINVVPGVPFEQTLRITNLMDCAVADVTLYQELQPQLTMVRSLPRASEEKGATLIWRLGTLGARESTTVEARVMASQEGRFDQCLSVTYVPAACIGVSVVAPLLSVRQSLPRAILGCETIPAEVTITNPGSAALADVKVTTILPNGLLTTAGEQASRFVVPRLGAGQSVKQALSLKAVEAGTYHIRTVAEAAGGLSSETAGEVMVRQPILTLAVESMERQYTGRRITYQITVANRGDATADQVTVLSNLPEHTIFVEAGQGGRLGEGLVAWELPPLAAGENRVVTLTVQAESSGRAELVAEATASCAEVVQGTGGTHVFGLAAVLLELVDLQDPIEVGNEGTYLVSVTNQGNKADTNLVISCTLEDSQTFVGAEGPTRGLHRGNTVTFAPLEVLAPGQEAAWRVKVKANRAGDIRFRAQLTSDQLTRPVHETESTRQY